MGSKYKFGGVAIDRQNNLYVCVNTVNKLYAINLKSTSPGPDSILFSTNAIGYANFCNVRSMTWMDSTAYNESVIFLLDNGEVWQKDLTTFELTQWKDPAWTYPTAKCIGATGIEYYNEAIFLTFPEHNCVRKLSLSTLQNVAEYKLGIPTDMPYAPGALSVDEVTGRWVIVDSVRGDLVYCDLHDFQEGARERYTYGIYGTCFAGDIAWSKVPLSAASPNKDYFVLCSETMLVQYGEPWFKLYEVNDATGTYTEVHGIMFDNIEIDEDCIKHYRLENTTTAIHKALTLSLPGSDLITADDYMWISLSPVGPWTKIIECGDMPGNGIVDFYIRFFPQNQAELGSFIVDLIIDYSSLE